MGELRLFMVLLGSKPQGRHTEQHDIYFGIGRSLAGLIPAFKAFWPEAAAVSKLHIDAWREVNTVDNYHIEILPRSAKTEEKEKLFFINLGGYKRNDFEEYHYKIISVAENKSQAISASKKSAFYLHYGFEGAQSHIDDKYGIDVDDIYDIEDLLDETLKKQFQIHIEKKEGLPLDELHIGYLKLDKIKD